MGIRLSGRTQYGEIAPANGAVAPWHARCWCGSNARLVSFAAGYLRCTACETLVSALPPVRSTAGVVDDAADFYGARYWTSHQTESLGNPAISERARDDLAERCIYWLRALLGYRRAPARLLEIGASHGGFLRLAQMAGFDATGIEMSPFVVRFAQRTFDVDMRLGPLQAAGIPDSAYDVVVAFDVLEHFDDPEAALREIRRVLRPGGIVLLQTPDYPARDAGEMLAANDPFLAHLRAPEHVFLFSRRAAVNILARTGFPSAAFAPPLFGYDMFVAAGTELPEPGSRDDVARALLASPDGRVVLALIDLFERAEQMRVVAAERLTVIEGLDAACDERLAVIELLDRELKQRS